MQAVTALLLAIGSGVPAVTLPVAQICPTDDFHGTETTIWMLDPMLTRADVHETF